MACISHTCVGGWSPSYLLCVYDFVLLEFVLYFPISALLPPCHFAGILDTPLVIAVPCALLPTVYVVHCMFVAYLYLLCFPAWSCYSALLYLHVHVVSLHFVHLWHDFYLHTAYTYLLALTCVLFSVYLCLDVHVCIAG